jgi:hypothetical protein
MALSTDTTELTLSPATKKAYARRCRQLAVASGQPLDAVGFTPAILVDYVIGRKRSYAANSWRLVRRSVVWQLQDLLVRVDQALAKEIMSAIARLRAEMPDPDHTRKAVTSRTKAKSLPENDLARIEHAALATAAKCATDLVRYLKAGVITGLRPCEWANAELRESTREGFTWMLVVANAKATNGRAHGPFRTLYWVDLPADVLHDINAWIEIASGSDYERRLATMGRLLWKITRELWPRRKSWPTLYSTRHAAVATWKAYYVRPRQNASDRLEALAIIAALMGHGSDDTASQHYARASRASIGGPGLVAPAAEPAEVTRVRQVIDLDFFKKITAKRQSEVDAPSEADPTPAVFSLVPSPAGP